MTKQRQPDEDQGTSTIAALENVRHFTALLERVTNRSAGLPGMACFHGCSGFGKTFAAIYGANKTRAHHIQVRSVWTRKKLCADILRELGVQPASTIPDMVEQIGAELSLSQRPLIIDEADYLLSRAMIECVRDIYESSQATIVLIGEEQLPQKLRRWERVHGRMLDWVQAQPATIGDVRLLAALYARGIAIEDDLLRAVAEASQGSARRICVNVDRVREAAEKAGLRKIGRADYKGDFFTGQPPHRSAA